MLIFNLILYLSVLHPVFQQNGDKAPSFTVMFYNTENLFDTADNQETDDDDFTPAGKLHWTTNRYLHKVNNLYKVMIACGDWNPPDIIGLCEIENRKVLNDLLYQTPLSKFDLDVIHYESHDKRGIDVAMVYNRKTVAICESRSISIGRPDLMTRDILYVKTLLQGDTCHLFINHWPSRSSGQLETEEGRISAALVLKHHTDSLFALSPFSMIMVMGDFNDEPSDVSMKINLAANVDLQNPVNNRLYNLSCTRQNSPAEGTLKYQGTWNLFDQVIVSGNLINNSNRCRIADEGYRIFDSYFLLEKDETYTGYKPFRTYAGFQYKGGFSDHLPVIIKMVRRY